MSDNHEWISKSGRPWSLRVKSDLCAKCGTTPDAHPARSTPAEALDYATLVAAIDESGLIERFRDAHPEGHRVSHGILLNEWAVVIYGQYLRHAKARSPHNREAGER